MKLSHPRATAAMDTLHSILIGTDEGLSPYEQMTLVPTETAPTAQQLSPEQRRCLAAEAQQWFQQGIAQYRQGQYTSALELLKQALHNYRSLAHQKGEAQVLLTLAGLYYQMVDYLWSLDYARQSLSVAEKMNHQPLIQKALSHLGNSYRHLKDLDKALTYMERSLQVAQAMADRPAEMRSLNNLAMIYRLQGEHQQAAQLYEASLLIADDLCDRITLEQILRNLGNTYHALGNQTKTIQIYEQLLGMATSASQAGRPTSVDPSLHRRILRILTQACQATGDHARAIHYLQRRLHLVRRSQDARSEAQLLEQLAQSYEMIDQVGQALDCYEQRLQVVIQLQDKSLQRQAFNHFRCACLSRGETYRTLPYRHLFEPPT